MGRIRAGGTGSLVVAGAHPGLPPRRGGALRAGGRHGAPTLIDPPRLISLGLLCSLVIVIVGLGDLPGVRGIGIVVIALGCSAAALTVAVLAGRGRNETSG